MVFICIYKFPICCTIFIYILYFSLYLYNISFRSYNYTHVIRQDVLCNGVVRPSGIIYKFPGFFLPPLQLLHWSLVYCFVAMSSSSSLRFGVIDLFCHFCSYRIVFLQESGHLILGEKRDFTFFRNFLPALKLGLMFCSKELQFQFTFQCERFIILY
jgi:hypothetical protein